MKFVRLHIILLIGVLWGSCEKDITLDIKAQSNKLVIYSFIYPDSAFQLHFSKSKDILSLDDYQPADNAGFKLYKNDEPYTEQRLPKEAVWREWQEITFKVGDKITIEAFERDGDTIRAETTLIPPVIITNIDTSYVTSYDKENGLVPYKRCKIAFNDPPKNNYYQLMVIREAWSFDTNDSFYNRNTVYFEQDDKVFTQRDQTTGFLEGVDFQGLFSDENIYPSNYEVEIRIPYEQFQLLESEDKVRLSFILYHHTFDYFNYFQTRILSEELYGSPFFDPVKVHNNISNGLGLFSGMAFHTDSIIINR